MSAARKSTSAPTGALTRADLVVRAARGHQRPDGGVVWSGMLYRGDTQVAAFHNEGHGGCCTYTIRDRALFKECEELAKREFPEHSFEQLDDLVGALWDAAVRERGV